MITDFLPEALVTDEAKVKIRMDPGKSIAKTHNFSERLAEFS